MGYYFSVSKIAVDDPLIIGGIADGIVREYNGIKQYVLLGGDLRFVAKKSRC